MSGFRLPDGGLIDRAKPLRFRFDGRHYRGYEGDSLASALIANGVRVLGRSFRLHRPRGALAAGWEEANAFMRLDGSVAPDPNAPAPCVRLRDGLEARALNAWPSARFDLGALVQWAEPFLASGFYYKTFKWPTWRAYAWAIRRLAGLGVAPSKSEAARYAKRHAFCDVLIVGAGPAGLAAARELAASGKRVILVEQDWRLGGRLLSFSGAIEGQSAQAWIENAEAELEAASNVTILRATTAFGYYDHNLVSLYQRGETGREIDALRGRLWHVRAEAVILATGALERPMLFPDNDRPGVMLASAAQTYLNRYGVAPGRVGIVAAQDDSGYEVALDLMRKGVKISAIVDAREAHDAGETAREAEAMGARIILGGAITRVKGASGVKAVRVTQRDPNKANARRSLSLACDFVAMAGGWSPVAHLFSQSGGKLGFDAATNAFVPRQARQNTRCIGGASGCFSLTDALTQARAAASLPPETPTRSAPESLPSQTPKPHDLRRPHRVWVDFQNDVRVSDVRSAAQEGYRSVEHLKRYTTLGMAIDQGKTSNLNGVQVLAEALALPPGEVGVTTFRPPFTPVPFGIWAGQRRGALYRPLKHLPAEAAHKNSGAELRDYGGWIRPARYPERNEAEEASIRREAAHVRRAVGLYDASPLGKILVAGPDAAEFLNRLYVTDITTLKIGRARYTLMLGDDGGIRDDGIIVRLAETAFWVGTTSAKAAETARWLSQWLHCDWPALKLAIENVTEQWATMTIAGPRARDALAAFGLDLDLTDAALPHMAAIETQAMGAPCLIVRASYTGERSYEINIAADCAEDLWRRLMEAGAPVGIRPFGVEALMRLRLEKGFLHVGADTEPLTYPQDVGFGAVAARKPADFIGRRSISRANAAGRARRELVGVMSLRAKTPIACGAHVLAKSSAAPRARSQGFVTSSGYSPILERHIALALVEGGASRIGEQIVLFDDGERIPAQLCKPCFFDPRGERLNV